LRYRIFAAATYNHAVFAELFINYCRKQATIFLNYQYEMAYGDRSRDPEGETRDPNTLSRA